MKTNYIDPFKKRDFSERFRAVLEFTKLNFAQVMKFYLPIFAAIAAFVTWLETKVPDSSQNYLGNMVGFAAFAYFAHYIANRGDVRKVSFKEMLTGAAHAFGRLVEASVLILGFALLFALVAAVYVVALRVVFGKGFGGMALLIACTPLMLFVISVIPVLSVYYVHYYFSDKEKSCYEALQESFRLVKGHWWDTFGFILLFGVFEVAILVPIILAFQGETTPWSGLIINLIVLVMSFFGVSAVELYQYGHLKALSEEQVQEDTKIITLKSITTAVVICMFSICFANFPDRVTHALLDIATLSGNSRIEDEVGTKYLKEKNYDKAFRLFLRSAEKGNGIAQYNLGNCYREGWGVAPDPVESFNWTSKSAAQGFSPAIYNLALYYMNGYGVEADNEKARELHLQAAEDGHPWSMVYLADVYTSGNGVERDVAEGAKWWHKAADAGLAVAQYHLGLCYLEGRGVAQDSLACFNWVSKAAEQNHVDALNQLAYFYAEGMGTDVNMGMAHTTIDKAIQIAPNYANLYDSKGEFYMLAGDRENAQAMHDKVVETDSMFYVHCTWSKLHEYIDNQAIRLPCGVCGK